jgi:fluoride ion exporter CrcB/FEX
MNTLLAVFIGGGLGSLARYSMSLLTTRFQLT